MSLPGFGDIILFVTCAALFFVGSYFIIVSRVLVPKRFLRCIRYIIRCASGNNSAARKSLALALAGTLGVGNIVGVAAAIGSAGPGCVFWMWVSAVFAMAVKYAETVVALKSRVCIGGELRGGAMYYIKKKALAALFALLCVFCSLTMGSALQSKAVAVCAESVFGFDGRIATLAMALAVGLCIFSARGRISDITAVLVPVMSILFVALSIAVIVVRASELPSVFNRIFTEAFSFRAASAGGMCFFSLAAVKYGVIRGILSNEAGCGTSPIAHAASDAAPADQGALGIVEVFVDTVLLCTLTAVVVLVSGQCDGSSTGMDIVLNSFAAPLSLLFRGGDRFSDVLLSISIFLFAFASVICWHFYGEMCIKYLYRGNKSIIHSAYSLLFVIAVFFGGVVGDNLLWQASDIVVAAMTVVNLIAVFLRRKEVFART